VLTEETVALDEVADMLATMLDPRFEESGIFFRQLLPDSPLAVIVDKHEFAQIFINLLSNALKFTPRGGEVVLAASRRADGSLVVSVRDTGIGIAAEDIPVVLLPFGQVESAFSRTHHGTGLGLPLAKSLAELHGGELNLESAPGVGTTVTVTLPAARVGIAAPEPARSTGA
jgi:signal transduction histidine kinase